LAFAIVFLTATCLLIAGYTDVRQFRIANIIPVSIIALFLCSRLWWGFTDADWGHGLHFVIALAVGMLLFGIRWIGGGDAKLYAATALWFSGFHAAMLIMTTALSGLVIAIGYVAVRKFGWKIDQRKRKDRRIPYGVAIAAGGILVGASVGLDKLIPAA
jgi:prepilin peptidase CpaA